MEYNESKNDIHVMKSNVRSYPWNGRKFRRSFSRTMTTNILKFYKKQTKSENHKICRGIMISYAVAKVKNWEGFAQVITYAPYKSKHLRRRSMELWRSRSDFESKWRSNSGLTTKLFVYAIDNLDCFMPIFFCN